MYNYISGTVAEVNNNVVVIDCGGVGYEILCTSKTVNSIVVDDCAKIAVYLNVKEDEMTLYGFCDKAEKAMFLNLISISGIGPKVGISILSGVDTKDLAVSIVSGNTAALNKIKGVGKKTAERIVVELKDKLSKDYAAEEIVLDTSNEYLEEAVMYLMAMGLTKQEATRKVKLVRCDGMNSEQIVVAALAYK